MAGPRSAGPPDHVGQGNGDRPDPAGGEQGIETAAAALGRSRDDYILDSYRSLFLQHRDAFGLSTSDMVFETEAALLRAAASD